MTTSGKGLEELTNVKISFTGVIDIKNISDGSVIQIEKNSTIDNVLDKLGIRKEHKKYLITIINGDRKRDSYVLQQNDHLSLFLSVGGG
jgi:hypothetical protein